MTQYPGNDVQRVQSQLTSLSADYLDIIARHLHQSIYEGHSQKTVVSLVALTKLDEQNIAVPQKDALLQKYPALMVLECLSIVHDRGLDLGGFLLMLRDSTPPAANLSVYVSSMKLAALLAMHDHGRIVDFVSRIGHAPLIVKRQFQVLLQQLLSLDHEISRFEADFDYFGEVESCLDKMLEEPVRSAEIRVTLMEECNRHGLEFRYANSGDYRLAREDEKGQLGELRVFIDHEERLWRFLKTHIVFSDATGISASMDPILRFFKRLQLRRSYLNEVEPLLTFLERTDNGQVWSAGYFMGMLRRFSQKRQIYHTH